MATLQARVCCRCGKSQAQGESLTAFTLLAMSARDAKLHLKAPSSDYFSPHCARMVMDQLKKQEVA